MENLVASLTVIFIICFLLSWIIPSRIAFVFRNKLSKGKTRLIFGLLAISFFVLVGITSNSERSLPKSKEVANYQEDVQLDNSQAVKVETPKQEVQADVQTTPQPQAQQLTESRSEEDQIKQLVSKQLESTNDNGKSYIRKIEVAEQIDEGKGVFVEYNADDKGAVNLRKEGIEKKMSDIYTAIFTSGKNIRRVSVTAYYPTVDKYGNTSDSVVYKTMLEKAEADKVNWNADKYRLETDILPRVWEMTLINIEFRR